MQRKLGEYGISNLKDMLFHLPLRYEDRTHLVPIGQLRPGQRAVVQGKVERSEIQFRGKRSLIVYINDGSDILTLRFFHFAKSQQQQFQTGRYVRCFGEARSSGLGLNIIHPEYQFIKESELDHFDEATNNSYTPIYPSTEGIGQARWRVWMQAALAKLDTLAIPELLPESLLEKYALQDVKESLRLLHQPPNDLDIKVLNNGQHPAILAI